MTLCDTHILNRPEMVQPFKCENVQPASIDLTLDVDFHIPLVDKVWTFPIDMNNVKETYSDFPMTVVRAENGITILPGQFFLASTYETVFIPRDIVARVEGKSSLARIGLLVHSTAGYIDPGFEGKITMELYNLYHRPIILRPGKKICQLSFEFLSAPAARPYGSKGLGSKYQGQTSVTASRYE